LNAKLATVDTDISAKINPSVNSYVTQYKDNNNLISTNMPKGLDTRTARALLMQFLAKVHMDTGALTVANVRKYAEVARILFNSDEIKDVYNALDQLSLSAKSEDDVQKLVDTITGFTFGGSVAIKIVQGLAVAIMFKRLGVANETIQKTAKAAGLEVEEVESSGFGMMDGIGKFATGVAIVMSVVQVVMDIIDIVDVVEQTQTMLDKLNGEIKESYQTYFNGIRDASKAYNAAINASGSTKQ
jgi:PP-loop superfamily ATP-utilizing enzyme